MVSIFCITSFFNIDTINFRNISTSHWAFTGIPVGINRKQLSTSCNNSFQINQFLLWGWDMKHNSINENDRLSK